MNINFSGKKIALIGGCGFIGHNLAIKLKELGADVFLVDSLQVNNFLSYITYKENTPYQELYIRILNQRLDMLRAHGIKFYIQDCRDYHALTNIIKEKTPDTIVHLAAVAHANRSNKDPYSTFDHSFRTLENALDVCRYFSEHFIFLSSSMIYGTFPGGFVTEDTPCEPLGIYGALKFGGEKLVIAYNQVFGMPYTIVRPSALYGQRCVSRRVGQIFIENALSGQDIKIQGDGNDRLDFTYIDDFLQGLVRVIGLDAARNQIFNITYGESRSLNDLVKILQEYFPKVALEYLPKDKLTPDRGTLSIEKARTLLGYDPQWPLEKGFPKYIEWYKALLKDNPGCRGELDVIL